MDIFILFIKSNWLPINGSGGFLNLPPKTGQVLPVPNAETDRMVFTG